MQVSKNFCASYLTKFSVDLDRNQFAVETCWCDEPHYFVQSVVLGENSTYVISSTHTQSLSLAFKLGFMIHAFHFDVYE